MTQLFHDLKLSVLVPFVLVNFLDSYLLSVVVSSRLKVMRK